jgi:hypothetical protein
MDPRDLALNFAKPYCVKKGGRFRLTHVDPEDTRGLESGDKPRAKEALERGVQALAESQERLNYLQGEKFRRGSGTSGAPWPNEPAAERDPRAGRGDLPSPCPRRARLRGLDDGDPPASADRVLVSAQWPRRHGGRSVARGGAGRQGRPARAAGGRRDEPRNPPAGAADRRGPPDGDRGRPHGDGASSYQLVPLD